MEEFEEDVQSPVLQPSVPIKRKETLSVVFIGHVDAGKSTIGGHLLHLTGMVDKRTLEKFAKEAKDKNRETWYLSWALDTNMEERDKGITVECGRAFFETENKHFILVDAPGHKSFVPNMIAARRGEFETGFEKGGQTREHAMLVKTAGVKHLIILINKMDDPTVGWDEARPCLLQYLDELPSLTRCVDGPVRIPIVDRYRDMGTFVFGKIESGAVYRGQALTIMPNKVSVEVLQVFSDDIEVEGSQAGDNVKLKLKNIEEEDISPGFVLCSPDNLC
ncbi:unnamed protein product, partial [Dibothriocephalus latus]